MPFFVKPSYICWLRPYIVRAYITYSYHCTLFQKTVVQCLTQINNRKWWLKSSIAIADRTGCMKSFVLSWLLREEYFSRWLLHHWQMDISLVRGWFYSIASLILFHCICCFVLLNNNSWEIFLQAYNHMELPYVQRRVSWWHVFWWCNHTLVLAGVHWNIAPLWEIWIFYTEIAICYQNRHAL